MASRPSLDHLTAFVPGLSRDVTDGISPQAALDRLPDRYFSVYDTPTVARHVDLICSVSREEPYALEARRVAIEGREERALELTIVTVDAPGVLSLLSGILGAGGFDIVEGNVFTLGRETATAPRPRSRQRTRRPAAGISERRIVDRFVGFLAPGTAADQFFGGLTHQLDQVVPLVAIENRPDDARRLVNESVAERIRATPAELRGPAAEGLFPLEVTFDTSSESATAMAITGEDTPFFLYSLSAALNLQHISIESVEIQTREHVITDVLELVGRGGSRIEDAATLDQVRFSVLLTKQFTAFLDKAPDPYSALVRFESLTSEMTRDGGTADIPALLASPDVLAELAQVLGASDFLWEDFIRLQYENLIPMLTRGGGLSSNRATMERAVDVALEAVEGIDERVRVINEFKDREAYLTDLDHILDSSKDFFFLSNRLSDLAEIVVDRVLQTAWDLVASRYGVPRGIANLQTEWAVFGLGKLGGRAIGYASDLELMLVYRDAGTTSGETPVSNAEFFERFFMEATGMIRARREGIFSVDLRLRPYGSGGPQAVSLESFNRYYGREGDAHSYELLALTRLRAIGGDAAFGQEVELLRDQLVYESQSIKLQELQALRQRQAEQKLVGGRLNAKFSPGGLVDLEYGLQMLLVEGGKTNKRLRTQSLHAGLEEFERTGFMDSAEVERLVRAYRFLRTLINGLRMLRGNATDLFLPDAGSLEFAHLARRLGYVSEPEIAAEEQLFIEFEARTASVRAFLEKYLGRGSIPGRPTGNAADLVLSEHLPDELVHEIVERAGLSNIRRARANLSGLAGTGESRDLFAELVILAWQSLRQNIDPDAALNNWERYVQELPDRTTHFRRLLRQPRMLELMLHVFATSSFLSETLIRHPETLGWALDRRMVTRIRTTNDIAEDLRSLGLGTAEPAKRASIIRTQRRREVLRIGTRDVCLHEPLRAITAELSALAEAMIRVDLEAIWSELGATDEEQQRFSLLAFGKQGGRELNYSSDIDLLGIWDDRGATDEERSRAASLYADALQQLRDDLASHTVDGHAYRLDFRLRPYGTAGPLVPTWSAGLRYYSEKSSDWEHQALIKVSPVAGNTELGRAFLLELQPISAARFATADVRGTIGRLREQAVARVGETDDIKDGQGGIRDIEFLVQGLQMVGASAQPSILTGNTLEAIVRLVTAGMLSRGAGDTLTRDYERFRRIEHFLQMQEDRQVHALPTDPTAKARLGRQLDGKGSTLDAFEQDLAARRARTRAAFDHFVLGADEDSESATRTRTGG